eukprot:TRINITY_DN50269_c0_g1_i1.p1 TRINITY_DN50269_c0_g1~~TRINITY_DN50269_c0_g1_i1.p1  ORF type:complete len:183 (-),score=34.50 TRINITY_DN50269_c0_g1_i1:88-636(-)
MTFEHAGMIPGLRQPTKRPDLRSRELDFYTSARVAPLPEYKPMFDVHLQHLWVNPRIRSTMKTAGFLDDEGRPVDVDAHRRKLYVIEQELAQADAVERHRAMDKERGRQMMLTLQSRRAAHQVHLDSVKAVRDERRRRREEKEAAEREAIGDARMSPNRSSSLPAIAGSPDDGRGRMAATFS